MKKIIILIFLFFSICLQAEEKHIFVLQSYSKSISWTADIDSSIKEVIKNHKGYQLTVEYMDTKRNNSKEYLDSLHKTLEIKFRQQNYDAIIVVDNDAAEFVLKFKDVLFKDSLIAFCGIDKSDQLVSKIELNFPKSLIVLESKDVNTNIDFILDTLPNLEYLYMISDKSSSILVTNHLYKDEIQRLENLGIKSKLNLDGNLEEIQKDIKNLPKNSAVLYGTLFQDKKDKYIEHYKFNSILENSKVPVFSTTDTHFGKGVAGGYLVTAKPMGKIVAQEVMKLLNNETLKKNPIEVSPEWLFDYNVLKKYDLENILFPKDSVIINIPQNFMQKHQKVLVYILAVFPILLVVLITVGFLYYRSNRLYKKLQTHSLLQEILLNNIQSSVFWTSSNNKVKGCNLTFSKFLNLKEEEIVSKNIFDIFPILEDESTKKNLLDEKVAKFNIGKNTYKISNQTFYDHLDKQQGLVSIITDITQSEQAAKNKQFIIQQAKLSEIGTMISAIAHQWKNPLVELSAISHKMLYYSKKNKLTHEHVNGFYEDFMKQTVYMSDTIDNFRDFIKPSKKAVFFSLNDSISDVLTFASHSIKYSNTKLTYKNNTNEKQNILGYPNEFKQVLLSIISNANDSINEQKEKISSLKGFIEIEVKEDKKFFTIIISDNGTGISKEIQASVFDEFFTTKSHGDGFGLYMAQLIITSKMDGSIKILPSKIGAKIEIILPKK